jgi:hypothetical protein
MEILGRPGQLENAPELRLRTSVGFQGASKEPASRDCTYLEDVMPAAETPAEIKIS